MAFLVFYVVLKQAMKWRRSRRRFLDDNDDDNNDWVLQKRWVDAHQEEMSPGEKAKLMVCPSPMGESKNSAETESTSGSDSIAIAEEESNRNNTNSNSNNNRRYHQHNKHVSYDAIDMTV